MTINEGRRRGCLLPGPAKHSLGQNLLNKSATKGLALLKKEIEKGDAADRWGCLH